MRKTLSLLLVITMLFSIGLVVTPVLAEETEDASVIWNDAEGQELAEDATFKGYLTAEPTSLDPAKASDNYAITVMTNIYEPLVLLHDGPEGGTEYLGGGAKNWEVSEDGLEYTFYLRENKWWDGEPVTAEQYAYSLRRAVNPETGCPYSYLLEPIVNAAEITAGEADVDSLGVEVVDDLTLKITLNAPTATFLELMGNSVTLPVRQEIVEELGEKYGSEADLVMGNGPFQITEWTHNSKISYEKSENYWNAENVYFEKADIAIISDTQTAMTAFEAGEIYSTSTNLAEWRQVFEDKEDVLHIQRGLPSTFFMMFNTADENGIFTDARIRLAFSAAINREEINEVMWSGNNLAAQGWVAPGINVGAKVYREEAPNFVDEIRAEYPEPKLLLDEALTDLGMEDKIDNLEVSLILGGTDQWFKDLGEYYQQVFKQDLGVDLKIEQLDWPIFSDRVSNKDYQIGYMAWGSELSEPNALLKIHADGSPQVGTSWNNDEYNELIKQAQGEADDEKRFELYLAAETILMNEAPVAPVVHPMRNFYRYDFYQNVDMNSFGNMGLRQGYLLAH